MIKITNKKQPPEDKKLSYRERNGNTRVGDSLRWLVKQGKEVAPELLSIAGAVTNIPGLDNLAEKIKGATGITDFDKKIVLEQLALDRIEMEEVTKRWEADMASDSWASKNLRPYITASTILFTFLLIIADSIFKEFIVKSHWAELLSTLVMTMVIAYFGSRGVEKLTGVAGKFTKSNK
jgi:hypothetical protein